jgi:hypothetical protein
MVEYKDYIIYNFTPHTLDFADVEPGKMKVPYIQYSVPSDGVLNAITEDRVHEVGDLKIIERETKISPSDIRKLKELIEKTNEKGKTAIIYVSRIYADALKNVGFPLVGNAYVIGAIQTATARGVKPIVASWLRIIV